MKSVLNRQRPDTRAMTSPGARVSLTGGALAGPLLLASSIAQGATREGFSFIDHPPSALGTGDLGWLQVTTFVIAGATIAAAGFTLRTLLEGPGALWGPRLLIAFGAALTVAGVFPMDPAFGFPPGTATGMPDQTSWHAAVHGIAFPIGFGALLAACFVFARRFNASHRRAWRWFSVIAGPASLALASVPNALGPEGHFLPMWLGVTVAFVWCSAVITDLRRSSGGDR